ncbi:MAG: hypothetical protein FJZ04_02995 [Candidatus Moranbacteria bacterium]|nr:hypothetical protein [Candidatus Moranbacteria bacterium]
MTQRVCLEAKIAILRAIGFNYWSEDTPENWKFRWNSAMATIYGRITLPQVGSRVDLNIFSILFTGGEPEYHPTLGYYFLLGFEPFFDQWGVYPPKKAMGRISPLFALAYAACIVPSGPPKGQFYLVITTILDRGIVRGKYVEIPDNPNDVFGDRCTTA